MNFSSGTRGGQGGRGTVPRLSSGDRPREESPNKAIQPKVKSQSKLSPSKSFQQRVSQREEENLNSKIRGGETSSFSSLKNDTDLYRDESDYFTKQRSVQRVLSSLSIEKDLRKSTGRYTAAQRRSQSLDGIHSDDAISPRARRTKSEDDVAKNARRSLRGTGGRRPRREDSLERRLPSRSSKNLSRGEISSLVNAEKKGNVVSKLNTDDGTNERIHNFQSDESSRLQISNPLQSPSGDSVASLLRNYSSGDFSRGSLNVAEGGKDRDVQLVDIDPSALRTPDNRYRRQRGGLPTFLFDPKSTDRTSLNKTPFSSRVMESTSSDSSDQRLLRKEESDIRFQANTSSCPSVSTCLDDSCVVLIHGAPNIPRRTVDGEEDHKNDKADSPVDSKDKSTHDSPLASISFFLDKDPNAMSSISSESSEDDINSVGSFCPSISECISTGTSMADEAPKMPGRGLSQLSMESTSALGALDDDRSTHESRSG